MLVCDIPADGGGDSLQVDAPHGRCEQCGEPLGAPKARARKDQRRRFCQTKCRAMWHHRARQHAVERVFEELNVALRQAQANIAVIFTKK